MSSLTKSPNEYNNNLCWAAGVASFSRTIDQILTGTSLLGSLHYGYMTPLHKTSKYSLEMYSTSTSTVFAGGGGSG
jgi:hypothetical protein